MIRQSRLCLTVSSKLLINTDLLEPAFVHGLQQNVLYETGSEGPAGEKPKRDTFMPPSYANGQASAATSPSGEFQLC